METKYDGAVVEVLELSQKDLSDFSRVHIKRDLRPSLVNKIATGLTLNGRIHGVITLNLRDGKLRPIDGNHRVAGIERFLQENPDKKATAIFVRFKNLTDEQEQELYLILNDVAPQNKMDYIQTQSCYSLLYRFLIGKKKEFPLDVTVRPCKKIGTVSFQWIVEPYLMQDRHFSRFDRVDFFKRVNELTEDDFEKLFEFAGIYVELFGTPEPDVITNKSSFWYAFQILYWSARGSLTIGEFKKRMKLNLPNYQKRIQETFVRPTSSGESKMILFYRVLLECLNRGAHGSMTRVGSILDG